MVLTDNYCIMNHQPEIAIVTTNLLMGMGLKSVLERIIPVANIELFTCYSDLIEADSKRFSHFFISYNIFCSDKEFFLGCGSRTIVMVDNPAQSLHQGMVSLNISQTEEALVKDILKLRNHSHVESHAIHHHHVAHTVSSLTEREVEVLRYIAQGHINKEIADMMNISITTVISHRKNIIGKLGIKSVAGLTMYAISNGIVEAESIVL